MYHIEGTQIPVCPVAYITPESAELASTINRLCMAREASGASVAGPDLMRYPPRLIDALITIESEERRVKWSEYEADRDTER